MAVLGAVTALVLGAAAPSDAAVPGRGQATAPEGWLPHPMPAPAVPSVAFVGDSIGRDAQYYVRNQVGRTHPIAYYHSVAAGYVGYHLPRLRPVVEAPRGPDILLVELGTGDAFWDHSEATFEHDVRRFLDAVLPHVTCVRWFDQKPTANIAYPHVNEHRLQFNRILARVLAEPQYASRNVALVPYSAWYWRSGDDGFFLADRLHHTEAGRRELGLLAGQAAEGCDPAFTHGPFWDVPDRVPWAEAVSALGLSGIVEPYRNGTFRADLGSFPVELDRGALARYLWRMSRSPTDRPLTTWTDVPSGLRRAVGWAQSLGILRSYPDGTFRPGQPVTRGGLAAALWRGMRRPTTGVAHLPWTDVPADLVPAVDWIVGAGIIAARPGHVFDPDEVVNRATAARVLYAFTRYVGALLEQASAPSEAASSASSPTTLAGVTATTTTAPTTTTTTPPVSTPPTIPVPTTTAPAPVEPDG